MKKISDLLIKAFPYYFAILIILTLLVAYWFFHTTLKFTFQNALDAGAILSVGTCTYAVLMITSIFFTKEKVYE